MHTLNISENAKPNGPKFISAIHVTDLFGLYTYDLRASDDAHTARNLLILYGDNGSGKTTILKLVFHLLSDADNRGHRTFLAGVPFRALTVRLEDGTTVSARRQRRLTGSYKLTLMQQGRRPASVVVHATTDGKVRRDKNPNLPRFLRRLQELHLILHYLSDDRRREGGSDADDESPSRTEQVVVDESGEHRMVVRPRPAEPEHVLEVSVRRLDAWIRERALKASSQGEANTNTIYAEIIKRIGRARGLEEAAETASSPGLHEALVELEHRSKAFSEFNLVSPLQVAEIVSTLNRAPTATQRIMLNVLIPYVDGLKARLDALQGIQDLLRRFVEAINSFLTDKTLSFTLPEGVRIVARSGQSLGFRMLSSGERQLLLLFCNTITARDQASVFIIDEPEISLNVKWQRRLLESLLQCAEGSSVHFIVATHSVELLSRHLDRVMRLSQNTSEEVPVRE